MSQRVEPLPCVLYSRGATLEDFLDILTYECADGTKRCAAQPLASEIKKTRRTFGFKLNTVPHQ